MCVYYIHIYLLCACVRPFIHVSLHQKCVCIYLLICLSKAVSVSPFMQFLFKYMHIGCCNNLFNPLQTYTVLCRVYLSLSSFFDHQVLFACLFNTIFYFIQKLLDLLFSFILQGWQTHFLQPFFMC